MNRTRDFDHQPANTHDTAIYIDAINIADPSARAFIAKTLSFEEFLTVA
jgi:hypothetical protein